MTWRNVVKKEEYRKGSYLMTTEGEQMLDLLEAHRKKEITDEEFLEKIHQIKIQRLKRQIGE
jgi:hypothetical protein